MPALQSQDQLRLEALPGTNEMKVVVSAGLEKRLKAASSDEQLNVVQDLAWAQPAVGAAEAAAALPIGQLLLCACQQY